MTQNIPFITVAIHTYEYAIGLKNILESNGIRVELQSVSQSESELSPGVRIRIPADDLSHALELIESSQNLSPAVAEMKFAGMSQKILIPIDFSDYSIVACKVGFSFAKLLGLHPVLMHVFATPYFDGSLTLSDNFTSDLRDTEARRDLEDAAKNEMNRFSRRIRKAIEMGHLENVKYSTHICEGVPEEAIISYAKNTPPVLIVMATRGKDKKAQELIGSVTAEVIDSCRVPVFTVPEGCDLKVLDSGKNVVFFCNIDQLDLLAMDAFVRLTNYNPHNIILVPVNDRVKGQRLVSRTNILLDYFRAHYPESRFSSEILVSGNFREAFEVLVKNHNISLIIVPNKKKNIFSRLFSPSIAHKIIFEKDMSMLSLPV